MKGHILTLKKIGLFLFVIHRYPTPTARGRGETDDIKILLVPPANKSQVINNTLT